MQIGVWYWEFVEFARKLIFNALMVFIFPGSRSQLVIGFIIAAVFMLVLPRLHSPPPRSFSVSLASQSAISPSLPPSLRHPQCLPIHHYSDTGQ